MQEDKKKQVPKVISTGKHEYILIQQCNKNLWLYKDMIYGYKRAFTSFEIAQLLKLRKIRNTEV